MKITIKPQRDFAPFYKWLQKVAFVLQLLTNIKIKTMAKQKKQKVTVKTVEEVINPNKKLSSDVDYRILNKIHDTKERLLMKNNYEWQFKKTKHYWGNTHWRKIAQDVAKAIN